MITALSLAPKNMSQSEFDRYAADYDAQLQRGLQFTGEDKFYFAEQRIVYLSRCLAGLGFEARHVLDFGCGTGTATPYFFKYLQSESCLGLDVSTESIKLAQERYVKYAAKYTELRAYRPSGGIDLAFTNGVFHHIVPAQRPPALELICSALRPGGIFAFWENNPWNPMTRYMMSRVPFDRDAIMIFPRRAKRLLRDAGFDVLRIDYRFIFPRILRGLRPLERSLQKIPLGGQYQVLCRKPDR